MTAEVDIAVRAPSLLGEGAFWDPRRRVLYWVDIEAKRLHVFDPATGDNRTHEIGERVGTVVTMRSGGLLLALEHSLAEFRLESGLLTRRVPFEADLPGNRANDGKCDPAGRFWVGSMVEDDRPGGASLYRVEADFTVHRVLSGVTISNGIVWSLDRRRMYYIDTPVRRVYTFDYELESGEIRNQRVCFELPASRGSPDGMTIDADGMLWVALFGGWGVSRWDPADGRMMEFIELPVKNVTSCSFGGQNFDELYVTSARILLSERELAEQPEAGSLFRVKTRAQGLPLDSFAG